MVEVLLGGGILIILLVLAAVFFVSSCSKDQSTGLSGFDVSFVVQNGDEPRTAGSSDNSDTSALVLDTAYYVVTLMDSVFDPPSPIFNDIYDFLGATDVYDSSCVTFTAGVWRAGITYVVFTPMRIGTVLVMAMAGAVPNDLDPYIIIPARSCDSLWLHNVDISEAITSDWLVLLRMAIDSAGEYEAGVFGVYVDWTGTEFEAYMRSHLSWYGGVGLSDISRRLSTVERIGWWLESCPDCRTHLNNAINNMNAWKARWCRTPMPPREPLWQLRRRYVSCCPSSDYTRLCRMVDEWIEREAHGLGYSVIEIWYRHVTLSSGTYYCDPPTLMACPNTCGCSSCTSEWSAWKAEADLAYSDYVSNVRIEFIIASSYCDECMLFSVP
ncbi:hypothetical protein DRQ27_04405 [bacterium]|nr:MAG: hypothetical protein DRQ27_04405 [bacterium]